MGCRKRTHHLRVDGVVEIDIDRVWKKLRRRYDKCVMDIVKTVILEYQSLVLKISCRQVGVMVIESRWPSVQGEVDRGLGHGARDIICQGKIYP